MNELTSSSARDAEWERLRPVLDDALDDLSDNDRQAVLLRFFEGKSFADVGARLRLTENAARMRVERALDKLHALLARRGVTSTTTALAVALANQPAVAAPAGLAASVTAGALAGAATGASAVGWSLAGFMSTKTTVGLVSALVIAGAGTAWWGTSEARKSEEALAAATRERAALSAKLKDLETQVQGQARRVEVAEAENARLLAAAEKLKAPPPAAPAEVVTSGTVNTRYRCAQEMAKTGDPVEALRELLWCFDVGMPQITGKSGVRLSFLLSDLAKLGERYPAALEALRERRDKARQQLLASQSETTAALEFGALNRALKDNAANLALLDQLPSGDRRRRGVAAGSYDYLVEVRRYKDAAEAQPYSSISSIFESSIQERPLPATVPNPEEVRRRNREFLVSSTAKSIEMLAGAGDLEHARTLAQRLLAYDNTESTKALIQKHAERAGQPALFAPDSRSTEGKP